MTPKEQTDRLPCLSSKIVKDQKILGEIHLDTVVTGATFEEPQGRVRPATSKKALIPNATHVQAALAVVFHPGRSHLHSRRRHTGNGGVKQRLAAPSGLTFPRPGHRHSDNKGHPKSSQMIGPGF
jgi:hypothetical protein